MDYATTSNFGTDASQGSTRGVGQSPGPYGVTGQAWPPGAYAYPSYQQTSSAVGKRGCLGSGCLLSIVGIAIGIALILLLLLALPIAAVASWDFDESLEGTATSSPFSARRTVIHEGKEDEVIAIVDINGVITRTGERLSSMTSTKLVQLLKTTCKDSRVKAIVLDMDTPGGEVVAADEIHQAVQTCRASGLPVVTCMHSLAASGGYYIAAGTDWIVANRMTMTGSIGVIMNGMNVKGLMDKCGLESMVFKSGAMKDALSPMRKMSDDERTYIQHMIAETFDEFAAIVAQGRHQHFKNVQAVKDAPFADGRVVSGKEALALGLVDQLGGQDQALEQAARLAKVENPSVARYSLSLNWTSLLLDVMGGHSFRMTVSGMPRVAIQPGKLYFIAPECVADWD